MTLLATIVFFSFLVFWTEGLPQQRIIGGQPAYIADYPFVAAINVQTGTSRYFCGGTLFSREWIITAGQCVDGAILFTIRLGSTHLVSNETTVLTVATSEYVLHPEYDPLTLEHDIGLIKLRMPIEYTDYIQKVEALAQFDLSRSTVRVIGWGQTSDSDSSLANELKWAYVTAMLNEECEYVYGSQLKDSMVCVAGSYNEGSCHGDTGSAMLDRYRLYTGILVGVASFVSGNGCETTDPSGFTRIRPYVTWILNQTAGTS